VIAFRDRCPPHRHDLIADVIDDHATIPHHDFREGVERVLNPLQRQLGPQPLADRAEAADIGHQDRDLGVLAREQLGVLGKLLRQFAAEELLEPHALLDGFFFLRRALQAHGDRVGQRLGEHRFRLTETGAAIGQRRRSPLAIQPANHFAVAVANRGADDGVQTSLAEVAGQTLLLIAPDGSTIAPHPLQQSPAGANVRFGMRRIAAGLGPGSATGRLPA